MTAWLCATCANEFPDTETPPDTCPICTDERQYLPRGGQAWTTAETLLADGIRLELRELEPDLFALSATSTVGIGQRGLLLRTPEGSLLWEPPGLVDPAAADELRALGPVRMITASHPHLVGASVAWSRLLGNLQGETVPVLKHERDWRWITRPDPLIRPWTDAVDLLPGVRMYDAGGHFPGSSLVHWATGADGRGALLTGDTIAIGGDRASVTVMRSYVNSIPLPERAVRRILDRVEPLAYDRIYGAFEQIDTGAHEITRRSLERYIRWIRGDVEDY